MKVFIDTCIILDIMSGRKPHFNASASFLKLCGKQITGIVAASQTTDIFYILKRDGKSNDEAKAAIKKLCDNVRVVNVTAADVTSALASHIKDYEDAMLAFGAKRHKAEYIITRNEKDFENSPVHALSPKAFLTRFYGNCTE